MDGPFFIGLIVLIVLQINAHFQEKETIEQEPVQQEVTSE